MKTKNRRARLAARILAYEKDLKVDFNKAQAGRKKPGSMNK